MVEGRGRQGWFVGIAVAGVTAGTLVLFTARSNDREQVARIPSPVLADVAMNDGESSETEGPTSPRPIYFPRSLLVEAPTGDSKIFAGTAVSVHSLWADLVAIAFREISALLPQSARPAISNQQLANLVASTLAKNKMSGFNIDISVKDGVVTLEGAVSSKADQVAAGAAVARLRDVRTVINKLTIARSGTPPSVPPAAPATGAEAAPVPDLRR